MPYGNRPRSLLAGRVIGRLTLVRPVERRQLNGRYLSYWVCRCSCHPTKTKLIRSTQLYGPRPRTISCGCKLRDSLIQQGTVVGRWRVGKLLPKADPRVVKGRGRHYLCKCLDCGLTRVHNAMALGNMSDTSGCARCARRARLLHGHCLAGHHSPEYTAWHNMRDRCNPEKAVMYPWHAGRGIRVCDEWQNSFHAFLRHVGPRPSDRHQLDRIDNDGNYEPGNVRWATPSENGRNKSNNRRITVGSITACIAEWSDQNGIPRQTMTRRLREGWDEAAAVTCPVGTRRKRGRVLRALGRALTYEEWSREVGMSRQVICRRYEHYGWSARDAVTIPLSTSRKSGKTARQPRGG